MKKIILFILLLIFPRIIFADNKTIFSLSEVTASPGNNVTINLNIENNQQFGILTLRIHYDNQKLEYVSSQLKGLKSGIVRGTDCNEDKGLIALYAISLNEKKYMSDSGNILTVEFKITDNVFSDIIIELEIVDFGINDSKSLKYETKNGIIHVEDGVETVSKSDKKTLTVKNHDINENNIEWSSTDENVAIVDNDGNVKFKNGGNVIIEANDSEGNILYNKQYFVKDKLNNKKNYLFPIVCLVIFIFVIYIIYKKLKTKRIINK